MTGSKATDGFRRAVGVAALLALAACGGSGSGSGTIVPDIPATSPGGSGTSCAPSSEVERAAAALNAFRTQAGLVSLEPHPALTAAARDQACLMEASGTLTHRDGDSGITARLRARGYRASVAAENVAAVPGATEAVIAMWMGSDAHRRNILNPRMRHFGIGQSGNFWALTLAAPR